MIGLKSWNRDLAKDDRLTIKLRIFKTELKYAIQRAWRGYDDSQLWSMDYAFIELNITLLQAWLENGVSSHPADLPYDEWISVLNRLSGLLIKMDKARDLLLGEVSAEEYILIKKEFFDLYSKYFDDLWD